MENKSISRDRFIAQEKVIKWSVRAICISKKANIKITSTSCYLTDDERVIYSVFILLHLVQVLKMF